MPGALRFFFLSVTVAAFALAATPIDAATRGRIWEPGKRLRLNATVGQVSFLEGLVQETTRPIFNVTGQTDRNAGAESFSLEELGVEDSDTTLGLSLEYLWKYVTLQIDAASMQTEATGVAPRDMFLGVNEIRFEGQTFEYQAIPEGTEYRADLDAAIVGFRTLFTPVTLNAEGRAQFVPWIHLGLFGFSGQFDVEAGPALGVIQYENPVRDYVVNGRGDGEITAIVPELGVGGEVRVKLAQKADGATCLVLQGGYSIFDFQGSTSDLGISARNEKDLDIQYHSIDARALVEWPLSAKANLIFGAEARTLRADALSEAQDRSLDQTLALREKFDKDIDLEMASASVIFGFRW